MGNNKDRILGEDSVLVKDIIILSFYYLLEPKPATYSKLFFNLWINLYPVGSHSTPFKQSIASHLAAL